MTEIHEYDLNVLLQSFSEGICQLTARGDLVRYNNMAQLHWDDRLHNLTSFAPIIRALAGEQVYYELLNIDDHHILLVNTVPLFSGTNEVHGVIIITQNVSETVQGEQQAQIALSMLLEALLDTPHLDTIDEALRRVAVLIPQLEPVDQSIALRIDETTRQLIPIAHFGGNHQRYKAWHEEISSLSTAIEPILHRSSPAYLRTFHLGRPLMFDFAKHTVIHNPRNLSAAIYAPIFLGGHVIGILGAERYRPLDEPGVYFPQWSVDLLAALARLSSLALEQTALRTSLQQQQQAVTREDLNRHETFLLRVTHELMSPITSIRAQTHQLHQRIIRSNPPERIQGLLQQIEQIEQQSQRIEAILETLLEVSRADLGHLQLQNTEVDLVQLCKQALQEALPLTANHTLQFSVNDIEVPLIEQHQDHANAASAPAVKIFGDAARLKLVLTSLLSNALKYSPLGGLIVLSLHELPSQEVDLTITDQGLGIPLDDLPHLTERFYRGENVRASNIKGLGLGLYLVNEIISKHRGTLSVRSSGIPDQGSTFTIRLPSQHP